MIDRDTVIKLAQQALEALESDHPDIQLRAAIVLRAALAEPDQHPISDVTEAVTKTVIEVEKLLCEKLGREWQASGISIETLINELASRAALAEPEQDWIERERAVGYREGHQNALKQMAQTTHWAGCEAVHPECRKPEQEPVAWVEPKWLDPDTRGWPSDSFASQPIEGWLPLYTAPTPRKPLTVFEIDAIAEHLDKTTIGWATHEFAAAIEKAHGIGEQT